MVTIAKLDIKKFQQHILSWYKENKREFPWRSTQDPYNILVSEIMSQQTQIQRVVPKYENWLHVFPTLESLAKAPVREVLKHWSGLGYNRRALYLQKCAQEIVKNYSSNKARSSSLPIRKNSSRFAPTIIHWPKTEEGLMALSGIGKYTARAILCFAFNQQVAVVDTNVKKVILTQFIKKNTCNQKELEQIAELLLPKGKAREWNQALMDYAALMLKKEKIVIPKQSKFIGSDRFFRGKAVRFLLEKHSVSPEELYQFLNSHGIEFSQERFNAVIAGLEKDTFIKQKEGKIVLVE